MKTFPVKIKLTETVAHEWGMKEEGSYEDHGRPAQGHIWAMLIGNYLVINSIEEAKIALRSALYHDNGWDWGEHSPTDKLMKAMPAIIYQLRSMIG